MRAILLASVLALSACETTPTVETDVCPEWVEPIRYSVDDTARTIGQAREHNLTGEGLNCWEPPK